MDTPRRLGHVPAFGLAAALIAVACSSTTAQPAATTTADSAAKAPPTSSRAAESALSVPQVASSPAEEVPSALQSLTHDSFPDAQVAVSDITSGGPPPDGIPSIDTPLFVEAATVDWLTVDEPVLSLEIDGEARAYPVQIMTWHEIVNDTLSGIPVTVSYCPLCNSAVAYDRRLGERILDFGTSGLLYNSSLVMYDRQTESLWTHFDGAAVVGTLSGESLTMFPVVTVSFGAFVESHPDGLVLSRMTGITRDYGRNPYAGYDDPSGDPFLFSGDPDDRLPPQTRVVAIRSESETVVFVQDDVVGTGVATARLEGEPIVVFGTSGTRSALDTSRIVDGRDVGSTGVFASTVDGTELTFERTTDGTWRDLETGSEWNLFGLATSGDLAGSQLRAIPHLNTFWFAIAAFEPDTLRLA